MLKFRHLDKARHSFQEDKKFLHDIELESSEVISAISPIPMDMSIYKVSKDTSQFFEWLLKFQQS